ncbi:nucleotide-sugar transporter-domain-containing protein [Paraphysoderma sedebokerense]|nr:nucleotide-sugar transporter-domain-containing protein [Paraphysoderma sedebokerense]
MAEAQPSLNGIPLKYISLVTLVTQNSFLILSMRYSRTIPGPPYIISTAVLLAELIKLVISIAVHFHQSRTSLKRLTTSTLPQSSPLSVQHAYTIKQFLKDIFGPKSDALKIMIPALLYAIQNNIQYVAISLLDAVSYQVTSQLKILTTALFSVWLLQKSLGASKWTALKLLTVGVGLVQLPSTSLSTSSSSTPVRHVEDSMNSTLLNSTTKFETANNINPQSDVTAIADHSRLFGFCLLLIACTLSGLSGVYFEKVLKQTKASLWIRNIQLAFFSTIFISLQILILDFDLITQQGFWIGYNRITWLAILLNAVGGLIVALVVKYADNILKGFATSIAIILSSVISLFLFDFKLSGTFTIGAGLVMLATWLYGRPSVESKEEKEVKLALMKQTG